MRRQAEPHRDDARGDLLDVGVDVGEGEREGRLCRLGVL
jgi:hypothetical protein